MKKFFLPAVMLLVSLAVFAQDEEEHSAEYNFGKKYAIPIVIVVILIIVLIVWAIMRKRKKTP